MDPAFRAMVESLEPAFRRLLTMSPVTTAALPRDIPGRGVYLFSEGKDHLYVGRTNSLRRRICAHCGAGGENKAAFAFLMARHETGHVRASYRREGSRHALMQDPLFSRAFQEAKRRIRLMDVRYVGEDDATRQALLEMYAATVLGTRYNDFDNH